jgi:hypothetical protein
MCTSIQNCYQNPLTTLKRCMYISKASTTRSLQASTVEPPSRYPRMWMLVASTSVDTHFHFNFFLFCFLIRLACFRIAGMVGIKIGSRDRLPWSKHDYPTNHRISRLPPCAFASSSYLSACFTLRRPTSCVRLLSAIGIIMMKYHGPMSTVYFNTRATLGSTGRGEQACFDGWGRYPCAFASSSSPTACFTLPRPTSCVIDYLGTSIVLMKYMGQCRL